MLAICLTVGCKAQTASQATSDPTLDRRIEVTVRTNFSLPQDYGVTIGARKSSTITGYDELPVTITHAGKSQVISFLISTDGKKLARLDTFDLTKDPGSTIDIAAAPCAAIPMPR